MISMTTVSLVLLIGFVLAVFLLALSRPDSFRVERTTHIAAPPDRVFPHINDLHNWRAWSTWEHMDPNMQKTYSSDTVGKGARYEWNGNKKVGHGSMTIVESDPDSRVVIQLDFITPLEAHNFAELKLQPQDEGTLVNWSMHGPSPFISKLIGLFFSMDKLIGKDFEVSLVNLKNVAEKQHP